MSTITDTGARIMVQVLCRSFVTSTPANEPPAGWVNRALKLQDTLGRLLGVKPSVDDITEIITSFENLESIEAGTYPGVDYNRALTVDTRPNLVDDMIRRIYTDTNTLLDNIGFTEKAAA